MTITKKFNLTLEIEVAYEIPDGAEPTIAPERISGSVSDNQIKLQTAEGKITNFKFASNLKKIS